MTTMLQARDAAQAEQSFAKSGESGTGIRSIVLHVHDDAGMEARLQVALDLARAFDAHLTCLQPVDYDFAVPGDLYGTMVAELLPVMQEAADAVRERLGARLGTEDVSWDWDQQEGASRPVLLRAQGLADLVVLGARDPVTSGKSPSSFAGYVAVHGRSPLLVVPDSARSLEVTGPAVIGWNGSLEAAHALRGAVPLLRQASSVILASVAEPGETAEASLPGVDAAKYLSRHGIASEIVELARGQGTVAQALTNAAMARAAAYLVVGAYGHARTLETMFGGVTRELFCDPPLPLFTAH